MSEDVRPVAAPDAASASCCDISGERRLTELEIKSALADDAIDQLSQTIFRQQEQLEALAKEIARLRDLVSRIESDSPRSLRDDLPPHY